uniref:Uncharacterized protein n=1 Tax=Arundo donax TaxID=35708 RepID=A0A0A9E5R9_ARUDO
MWEQIIKNFWRTSYVRKIH